MIRWGLSLLSVVGVLTTCAEGASSSTTSAGRTDAVLPAGVSANRSSSPTPVPPTTPAVPEVAASTPRPSVPAVAASTPRPSSAPTVAPVVAPTAVPTAVPTISATWKKYDLTKPTSADTVITLATENFKSYTSTIRNPDQELKVVAQNGVDATLIQWVTDGATYVVRRFAYPKLAATFVDFIAIDQTWLLASYIAEGFSPSRSEAGAKNFCGGAPACGGTDSNLWNYSEIQKQNLMVTDKAGMAQTPGHEFFHVIQGTLAPRLIDVSGSNVPNWFWEGPAQFVGLQTAGVLGFADYLTVGRPQMTKRYKNGARINRTSNLSEIRANDRVTDPYAIGFAATELLVSQVGVQKMVNVYAALGKGNDFDRAFMQGTGIELADFYSMFEEVRGTLGFAKE